jgi:hypothetical protein
MTTSKREIVSVRGGLSHGGLRKSSCDIGVFTGVRCLPGIAAYSGHLVLRLMAGFVLFYTSRVIFKGHVTMEEIVFTLKHHWMTVDYEPFELYGIA